MSKIMKIVMKEKHTHAHTYTHKHTQRRKRETEAIAKGWEIHDFVERFS